MARLRLTFLGFAFFVSFGVVLFRAMRLQLFPTQGIEQRAQRQMNTHVEIVGRRGAVTDRLGRELAVSTNSQSIFVNPKLLKNSKKVANRLGKILAVDPKEISNRIEKNSGRKFLWIERQLNKAQLKRLEKLGITDLEGVGLLPEYRREFPQGPLAAHVVGFVSVDGHGLEGIEKQFNEELSGLTQRLLVSRDALGRPVFSQKEQLRFEQNTGSRVELTLDSRLQYSAEQALEGAVRQNRAEGGSVIVMDPRNGEILALANFPTVDLNKVKDFPTQFRRNRAITDPIEPGSVIKPLVVARALEDKIVNSETVLKTWGGTLRVKGHLISESDSKHYFEKMTISEILRLSSNVGMVVLKDLMGFAKVDDTFKKVGIGSRTGIELSGESKGIYRPPTAAQLVEQATLSFGHGLAMTPLQIASVYSTLANGGFRVRPHVIKRLVEGEVDGFTGFETPESDLREKVFSSETMRILGGLLTNVVEAEGTGGQARVEGFQVAGKTGTSQRVDYEKGGYESGAYISIFSGFFPAKSPRFVITVVIDKPSAGSYYGGKVAAPVFSQIARDAARLGLSHSDRKIPPLSR